MRLGEASPALHLEATIRRRAALTDGCIEYGMEFEKESLTPDVLSALHDSVARCRSGPAAPYSL